MKKKLSVVVIGFGKISHSLNNDKKYSKYFPLGTHAKILKNHPLYDFVGVVDSNKEARFIAKNKWSIKHVFSSVEELKKKLCPDVIVISTPVGSRLNIIREFPNIKGFLCEKPLSLELKELKSIIQFCAKNRIMLQTNYWRRGNVYLQKLAFSTLEKKIGNVQAVFATYGNGIFNNGAHLLDFIFMLFGKPKLVSAQSKAKNFFNKSITYDIHIPFTITTDCGININVQPLNFEKYREVGVDIWGEKGRINITQEFLKALFFPVKKNRGLMQEKEIASDSPQNINIIDYKSYYNLYSNLANSINNKASLVSPASNELIVHKTILAIKRSADKSGVWERVI